MNQCHFLGRLTRDPQLKDLGDNKKVVSFGMAINRPYKRGDQTVKETAFIECEAWDSGADLIAKYFKKGSQILVDASVKTDEWEDKATKERRTRNKFRVNKFYFVGEKPADQAPAAAPTHEEPAPTQDDGAEIPF